MDTAMVPEFHQTLSGKGPQQGFLQRRHTGGQLVCGRCWTPLIIRKIQVTTTMRSRQAGNLSALPPHFSPGLRSVSIDGDGLFSHMREAVTGWRKERGLWNQIHIDSNPRFITLDRLLNFSESDFLPLQWGSKTLVSGPLALGNFFFFCKAS